MSEAHGLHHILETVLCIAEIACRVPVAGWVACFSLLLSSDLNSWGQDRSHAWHHLKPEPSPYGGCQASK